MSDDRTDEAPEPMPEETGRSLVQRAKLEADTGDVLAIIPRNVDEAQRYASGLIAAGIVPDSYRFDGKKQNEINAPLVLMGVLKAMELGLPPQTGIGALYAVNGRFSVYGDGAIGLIQRHRLIAKHTETRIGPSFDPATELADWPDDYGWEVRYWRVGQEEPYIGRFTVRDAKRGGMWLNTYKKPWLQYPDRMLFNRARAFALRDGFADALMGLGIAEEERDRLPDVQDGGELKPAGVPSYLSDEPETAALTNESATVTPDLTTGAEPVAATRDLGNEADRQEDF